MCTTPKPEGTLYIYPMSQNKFIKAFLFYVNDAFNQYVNQEPRPANSGGSWEPSSKKVLELQESFEQNAHTLPKLRIFHI